MKTAICLACCRPDAFKIWYSKWSSLFTKHNIHLFVAWDSDDKAPKVKGNATFIPRKDFPSYVPTKTSACRSAAVKAAYDIGYEMYMFLDDDVFPPEDGEDPIQQYKDGFEAVVHNPGYCDIGNSFLEPKGYTRGFPYKERHVTPIVAQYGGWDNVPDLDARDTIEVGRPSNYMFKREIGVVPKYQGFTGCFMNCAFRHEVVPALFHLHQGTDRCGYDRFDDIWASLILKRICDHFGWSIIINGKATCYHDRLSNPIKSVLQEQHGHVFNENLWELLQRQPIPQRSTFNESYYLLTKHLPMTQQVYAIQWIEEI